MADHICFAFGEHDSYFYNGTRQWAWQKLPQGLDWEFRNEQFKYVDTYNVAIGPKGKWYIGGRRKCLKTGVVSEKNAYSNSLPVKLLHWIPGRDTRTLRVVFGEGDAYFAWDQNGYVYDYIPLKLATHFEEMKRLHGLGALMPRIIALGYGGSYMFVSDQRVMYDLNGCSAQLDKQLDDIFAVQRVNWFTQVKLMTINPHKPGEYLIIDGEGTASGKFPDSWDSLCDPVHTCIKTYFDPVAAARASVSQGGCYQASPTPPSGVYEAAHGSFSGDSSPQPQSYPPPPYSGASPNAGMDYQTILQQQAAQQQQLQAAQQQLLLQARQQQQQQQQLEAAQQRLLQARQQEQQQLQAAQQQQAVQAAQAAAKHEAAAKQKQRASMLKGGVKLGLGVLKLANAINGNGAGASHVNTSHYSNSNVSVSNSPPSGVASLSPSSFNQMTYFDQVNQTPQITNTGNQIDAFNQTPQLNNNGNQIDTSNFGNSNISIPNSPSSDTSSPFNSMAYFNQINQTPQMNNNTGNQFDPTNQMNAQPDVDISVQINQNSIWSSNSNNVSSGSLSDLASSFC